MLTSLTKRQEELLDVYAEEGIRIGLCTSQEFDADEVRKISDEARKEGGLPPAGQFIVFDSPMAAMKAIPTLTKAAAMYGQHDIHWLQYYNYYDRECGIDCHELRPLYELAKRCGWMWMSERVTIITRKPMKLVFNDKNVLHNDSGYSILYRDGNGVCVLNDRTVPEELEYLILRPIDEISLGEILLIQDEDIKKVLINKKKRGWYGK